MVTGGPSGAQEVAKANLQVYTRVLNLPVVGIRLKALGPPHANHLANIFGGNIFLVLFSFSQNKVWKWCWQGLLVRRASVWRAVQLAPFSMHIAHIFSVIQHHSGPCTHSFCMTTTLHPSRMAPLVILSAGCSLPLQRSLETSAEINGTLP